MTWGRMARPAALTTAEGFATALVSELVGQPERCGACPHPEAVVDGLHHTCTAAAAIAHVGIVDCAVVGVAIFEKFKLPVAIMLWP